jgi:lipoprotein-anchoring transpeptidase ErfK/SrfK
VAKAKHKVVVYRQANTTSAIRATLPKLNAHGFPTLMLVRSATAAAGRTWYHVLLARRPNGSTGWVDARDVTVFETSSRIVIDTSARRLTVYHQSKVMAKFSVAVGSSTYPTPAGFFFIAEKIRPSPTTGTFGVLALGLSGYQPKLPARGALAIHGTNDTTAIGKAVSEGCIRMRNSDVLAVSRLVISGSPVIIKE